MTDSHTTAHVPVWGITQTGRLVVVGTVSVDRTRPVTTYTAQHDEDSATFRDEMAAAEWLSTRHVEAFHLVLVGRVFRPEAVARLSTSERVRAARDPLSDALVLA